MNRRIYLIILYIVTIFICISAVSYHTGRVISGCAACVAGDFDWDFDWDDGLVIKNNGTVISEGSVEEDFDEKGYKNIDVDGAVGDLTITEGDGYSCTFVGNEKLKPTVSVKNNTLVVKQKKIRNNIGGASNYSKINITVPKDTLGRIEIVSAVGDVYLKNLSCTGIKAVVAVGNIRTDNVVCDGKTTVEANVGEIILKNSAFGDLDLNSDVGRIRINDCSFEDAEIDSDIGNVEIDGLDADRYNFDIDCSLGDFELDGKDYGRKGRIKNSGADYTLTVNSDLGDVKIHSK